MLFCLLINEENSLKTFIPVLGRDRKKGRKRNESEDVQFVLLIKEHCGDVIDFKAPPCFMIVLNEKAIKKSKLKRKEESLSGAITESKQWQHNCSSKRLQEALNVEVYPNSFYVCLMAWVWSSVDQPCVSTTAKRAARWRRR